VMLARRPRRRAGAEVGVVEVDVVVGGEAGVEGDPEKAALASRVDVQVEGGPRRPVAAYHLDVPALFEDVKPAIGCGGELHRGRAAQPRDDRRPGEPGRKRCECQPVFERLDTRAGDVARGRAAAADPAWPGRSVAEPPAGREWLPAHVDPR